MPAGGEFVIEALAQGHDFNRFDCGKDAMSVWLKRFAWPSMQNGSTQVYVARGRDRVVVGYHALTAGSVSREEIPERMDRRRDAYPIGVIVLVRLAVDLDQQSKGIGAALLQDALLRAEQAAGTVGVRAIMVQAIDAAARSFYLRFGFSPSPVDEMRLMMLMKDLRAFLGTK